MKGDIEGKEGTLLQGLSTLEQVEGLPPAYTDTGKERQGRKRRKII